MSTIMIPEVAVEAIASAQHACRQLKEYIYSFQPRQISVGMDTAPKFSEFFRNRVKLWGGGTTVFATVVSGNGGQAGTWYRVVRMEIRTKTRHWVYKSGWLRPVLTSQQVRLHQFPFRVKDDSEHRPGYSTGGYTSEEIRQGKHRPQEEVCKPSRRSTRSKFRVTEEVN